MREQFNLSYEYRCEGGWQAAQLRHTGKVLGCLTAHTASELAFDVTLREKEKSACLSKQLPVKYHSKLKSCTPNTPWQTWSECPVLCYDK